jgi:hypothetical protein
MAGVLSAHFNAMTSGCQCDGATGLPNQRLQLTNREGLNSGCSPSCE